MPEIIACADDEAVEADNVRIVALKDLLQSVSDEPTLVAKLKLMEQNWVRYRDAYLNAAYPYPSKHGDPGQELWIHKAEEEVGMDKDHTALLRSMKQTLTIP